MDSPGNKEKGCSLRTFPIHSAEPQLLSSPFLNWKVASLLHQIQQGKRKGSILLLLIHETEPPKLSASITEPEPPLLSYFTHMT